MNIEKSLLGIDALYNKKVLDSDINEARILEILEQYNKAKIIVSPIGGQGFIFGRGNKQFTPEVIKKIGKDNIIIISTEEKLKELSCLRVDTGNSEVDEIIKGFRKAIIGFEEKELIEVK